ncbi:ribokinase [Cellulomonas sp. McL0617]|uniref:ribokinase n=1 Tax=Cellulomonas sp. McL0617 TaxID=3415675 RepID=UPI003CF44DBF
MSANVLVVGSANLDFIIKVGVPPRPGQTVLAKQMVRHPGGKGANQAVAAARMGADVQFVGCVGDDADGERVLRDLRAEGIDMSMVEIVANVHTGLALVSVFDSGENSITVVPGANFALRPERVRRAVASSAGTRTVLVLQAEVRPAVAEAAVAEASLVPGTRVVLNLAPYVPASAEVLAACDPLVLNQSEAADLVGYPVPDPAAARRALVDIAPSVRSVVITLGGDGAVWAQGSASGLVPAPAVSAVVDSTGAGDAFVGALAAELAHDDSLERAVEVGVRAGSFAVERFGAQSSYPMRSQLEAFSGGPVA